MSQVTITDVRDVRTLAEAEIRKWIAAHRADPKDHRYTEAACWDLHRLEKELIRRGLTP